jgi:hypothetical protein
MTAAGSIAPAKMLILGAGVAGLQSHVNGGYKDDFFIKKMKEFDADFLKIDTFDIKNFTNYYSLNDNNLFTKHNLSESQLKILFLLNNKLI